MSDLINSNLILDMVCNEVTNKFALKTFDLTLTLFNLYLNVAFLNEL
jgi:hypothetical protein